MDARTPDTDVAPSENAVFRVTGMDCGACVTKIETAVRRLPGVSVADASLAQGRLTVAHDGTADMERVARQVRNLGYRIAPARDGDDVSAPDAAETVWWRAPKARLTAGYAGLLAIAIGVGAVLPDIGQMALLAALLVGLAPIARRAFAAAGAGTPFSIEMLMTIAAAGAAVIGGGSRNGGAAVPHRRTAGRGGGRAGAQQHPGAVQAAAGHGVGRGPRRGDPNAGGRA